jgi:hypothetical protein
MWLMNGWVLGPSSDSICAGRFVIRGRGSGIRGQAPMPPTSNGVREEMSVCFRVRARARVRARERWHQNTLTVTGVEEETSSGLPKWTE